MEVEDERGIAQLFCETLCLLCGWHSLIWTPKWGEHQCMIFCQSLLCLCKPTFSWFVKTILFPQFSSLQNRDFLKFTLVPSPRLPQLFRQTFEELSEARDNEYKKLTGKAESSDKKNEKCWCGQSLWHFLAFTPLNECSKCFILGALDSGAWIAMVSGISKHSWPLGYPWGPSVF